MTSLLEAPRTAFQVAYEVGHWSYWNDGDCPYSRDEDVAEWYRGYCEASSYDTANPANQEPENVNA